MLAACYPAPPAATAATSGTWPDGRVLGAIVIAGTKSSLKAGDPHNVAFTNGFHHALEVGAALVLVGAAIAFSTLHHVRHHEEPKKATEFAEAA